jgi:hypothetical protein
MLSQSDINEASGYAPVPVGDNSSTKPTSNHTAAADPASFPFSPTTQGNPPHVIVRGTDQTDDGLQAVYNKFRQAVPGLTPKIFEELSLAIRRLGVVSRNR